MSGQVRVVSFYAPREVKFPEFKDYIPILECLEKSARLYGAEHIVITDTDLPFKTFKTPLPGNLMHAILAGWRDYLASDLFDRDTVLCGADCLVNRRLEDAFGDFDVLFTNRKNCGLNSGASYLRPRKQKQLVDLYDAFLKRVGVHWGADQNAMIEELKPPPREEGKLDIEYRDHKGLRVAWGPMAHFNCTPMTDETPEYPFILHYKGTRKDRMKPALQVIRKRFK